MPRVGGKGLRNLAKCFRLLGMDSTKPVRGTLIAHAARVDALIWPVFTGVFGAS
jgi:hypothetical protein